MSSAFKVVNLKLTMVFTMYTISDFISVLITFEKYAHVNNHTVKLEYCFILGRYKDLGVINIFLSKFLLVNTSLLLLENQYLGDLLLF